MNTKFMRTLSLIVLCSIASNGVMFAMPAGSDDEQVLLDDELESGGGSAGSRWSFPSLNFNRGGNWNPLNWPETTGTSLGRKLTSHPVLGGIGVFAVLTTLAVAIATNDKVQKSSKAAASLVGLGSDDSRSEDMDDEDELN